MNQNPSDLEDLDGEEANSQRRGSTHSMWMQRRQAKQRKRVSAKRRSASMAATNGMHMRRNKRVNW